MHLWFLDLEDPIYGQIFQNLVLTAGPVNDEFVDFGRTAQTEMRAAIVLRKVARSSDAFGDLSLAPGEQFQMRADAIAVTLLSCQAHGPPVIFVLGDVVQQSSACAQVDNESIDLSVIVVVGKASAS